MIDVGSRIRDYEIVARLKAGGMATLFLARRSGAAGFARHVAIKVVHPHLASDPEFVRMFVDEAKLSARIVHPNVVHVEELGEADGTYFLVMEYVHGSALSTLLAALSRLERRLAPELAVWIAMRVADGLHAAHELRDETGRALGVVHRDVSPQNVLVSSAGHVKLIDFGIAKVAGLGKRTETGALKGKIRYMSPEQAHGRAVDRRTDVYALGIVLWEMLTMQRMFRAQNELALLDEVRAPQIEPPGDLVEGLPAALDRAVMRALAREPSQRPATAQEFKKMLADALPAANGVDPSRLAEVVDAVLGERIEARRRELPDSLSIVGGGRRAAPSGERNLHAHEVLKSMTVSAPGARYQPEGEVSLDALPQVDARLGEPASRTPAGPGRTPFTSSSAAVGMPPWSRDRLIAMVASGVALVALGVAAGVWIATRGAGAPAVPAVRAAAAAPVAMPAPPPSHEPPPAGLGSADAPTDAGIAAAAQPTPVETLPRSRTSATDRPRPSRRIRTEPADPPGVRRAVDHAPIYEDDW